MDEVSRTIDLKTENTSLVERVKACAKNCVKLILRYKGIGCIVLS